MRVFVTGSSGHLAAALLPRLCAHPTIESVTGADRVPPRFAHPKFRALLLDVRDPRLAPALAGHDALVHLAFVVLRGRLPEREMFEINVTGSLGVFRAARAVGIARMIHLSSAAVYGSGLHVSEEAPLAPLPGFLYAEHKAALEQALEREFPLCVRLRPHIVLGPHAQPLLRRLLEQPFYVAGARPHPPLQCVHEDDVARAVVLALERAASGPFNLAAEDSFSFAAALAARRRFALPLPLAAARAALRLAWRASGFGGEPAWIEGLARPLVLDCRRARALLGWRARYRAAAALAQT